MRKFGFFFIFVSWLFVLSAVYAVDTEFTFKVASRYYAEQNYKEAIEWFRKAAKEGHAESKYRLGTMYLDGKGADKNLAMGKMWIEIAAESGVSLAQYKLAEMLEDGIGVDKNVENAAIWYAKAGEQDSMGAILRLASWYKTGKPIPQDFVKARYWYEKAVHKNHAGAQFELAELFRLGQGGAIDYETAIIWHQKAADQGHAQAQLQLGLLYEQGQGVAANISTAAQWYEKAAQQNIAEAQYKIGDMLYQGQGVEQNSSAGIDWLQKAQNQKHQAAGDTLKRITDSTVAELKQLFDKRDYAAVIAAATPKRALGGEVSQLLEKAQNTEAALKEVPDLLQAQKLKLAYDQASQFDDPQLQALAAQARGEMDKAIAELQALYDRKAYDEVIAKGEQIKDYGSKVILLISMASGAIEEAKWPFTVKGTVKCIPPATVVFVAETGTMYGLNGTATGQGYKPVDEIWKDDPAIPGAKVNVGSLIQEGLEKCKEVKSNESLPPGVRYTTGGKVAALTEELLDKAYGYIAADDKVAFAKLLDSGTVIILKAGLKVQIVDTKVFSGKVKIRPIGETVELWTVMEAVTE